MEEYLRNCDADLLIVPELCTTGYFFHDTEQAASVAETEDGPFCTLIRSLSKELDAAIVAGFVERDGDRLFNSCITVLPDGMWDIYRKIHLFAEEKIHFSEGDRPFPVYCYNGVCFGVMICYDWRFPESVRTLALKGAQIVAHPSNLVAPPSMWGPVMQTRSVENKIFTITANRTGTETRGEESLTFHGKSQITAPNGSILASTDETTEGRIIAEIDPEKSLKKSFSKWNDIFSDRRPDMYEL